MLLIIGPDTPENVVDGQPHSQVEIAPTIASMMGFTTPLSTGAAIPTAIATDVKERSVASERTFSLHQNFPNPFNPTTTILFSVHKPTRVALDIFNLLGQKIRTLFDNEVQPGTTTVVWDGNDDKGRGMSSGTYLYRLTTEGFAETRKMLLLK